MDVLPGHRRGLHIVQTQDTVGGFHGQLLAIRAETREVRAACLRADQPAVRPIEEHGAVLRAIGHGQLTLQLDGQAGDSGILPRKVAIPAFKLG